MPSIHVGGTNGKGSVATLVAAALRAAGWRVGLYTSPHLVSFRERIRVDGVPISEEAVAMWTARLRPLILERKATFFEATTAMAFADFAARGAEIAVVEVGLGGRLDSTNVRPARWSACVTKIERDHMKYLGDTLELIACEKAGIAKPGVPFVIGERDPAIWSTVLRREAPSACRAAIDPAGVPTSGVLPPEYEWRGPLEPRGAAPAAQRGGGARDARWRSRRPGGPTRRRSSAGFGAARIPGRLDRRGKWLFDVAHNPDGMRALVAALDRACARRGRSTRWSPSWATRSGRRCWSSSTGSWSAAC